MQRSTEGVEALGLSLKKNELHQDCSAAVKCEEFNPTIKMPVNFAIEF
jgi:hypothetical protein